MILVLGLFGYRWWKHRHDTQLSALLSPNPQTSLGNESKSDQAASNTYQQNQALANSPGGTATPNPKAKVTLPTPILTKSSGNNGAASKDILLEFSCAGPAGYQCKVVMTGSHTQTFDNKQLTDDGRSQPSVSWEWTTQTGKYSVQAVLSDGKGNEQVSSAQSLEVN